MTTISRSALVPYSAEQMYVLVDDIESYPKFLPWCLSAEVLSRDEDEVRAVVQLARGGLQKSFITCNRLQKNKMIEIRLLEGPFRHLEGFWRFDALAPESCKVSLDMDFEFSNRLIGMVFGPVFHQITNTLVDAFCQRANDIYGKDTVTSD
jgi:ribosome-associated toxin RatA of RatAB toxin-antitoxin module